MWASAIRPASEAGVWHDYPEFLQGDLVYSVGVRVGRLLAGHGANSRHPH